MLLDGFLADRLVVALSARGVRGFPMLSTPKNFQHDHGKEKHEVLLRVQWHPGIPFRT